MSISNIIDKIRSSVSSESGSSSNRGNSRLSVSSISRSSSTRSYSSGNTSSSSMSMEEISSAFPVGSGANTQSSFPSSPTLSRNVSYIAEQGSTEVELFKKKLDLRASIDKNPEELEVSTRSSFKNEKSSPVEKKKLPAEPGQTEFKKKDLIPLILQELPSELETLRALQKDLPNWYILLESTPTFFAQMADILISQKDQDPKYFAFVRNFLLSPYVYEHELTKIEDSVVKIYRHYCASDNNNALRAFSAEASLMMLEYYAKIEEVPSLMKVFQEVCSCDNQHLDRYLSWMEKHIRTSLRSTLYDFRSQYQSGLETVKKNLSSSRGGGSKTKLPNVHVNKTVACLSYLQTRLLHPAQALRYYVDFLHIPEETLNPANLQLLAEILEVSKGCSEAYLMGAKANLEHDLKKIISKEQERHYENFLKDKKKDLSKLQPAELLSFAAIGLRNKITKMKTGPSFDDLSGRRAMWPDRQGLKKIDQQHIALKKEKREQDKIAIRITQIGTQITQLVSDMIRETEDFAAGRNLGADTTTGTFLIREQLRLEKINLQSQQLHKAPEAYRIEDVNYLRKLHFDFGSSSQEDVEMIKDLEGYLKKCYPKKMKELEEASKTNDFLSPNFYKMFLFKRQTVFKIVKDINLLTYLLGKRISTADLSLKLDKELGIVPRDLFADLTTRISHFVTSSIVEQKDIHLRILTLKRWHDIRNYLYDLRNFSAAGAVDAGLNFGAVPLLKSTMKIFYKAYPQYKDFDSMKDKSDYKPDDYKKVESEKRGNSWFSHVYYENQLAVKLYASEIQQKAEKYHAGLKDCGGEDVVKAKQLTTDSLTNLRESESKDNLDPEQLFFLPHYFKYMSKMVGMAENGGYDHTLTAESNVDIDNLSQFNLRYKDLTSVRIISYPWEHNFETNLAVFLSKIELKSHNADTYQDSIVELEKKEAKIYTPEFISKFSVN